MDGSTRVLVVDDTAADTAATVESAAPEYTVDAATAPRAARERLAEATYDCAVVAADPSTADGAATVATVRETAPDVPVLLFADDTTGVDTEAIAAGAIDHVRPPTPASTSSGGSKSRSRPTTPTRARRTDSTASSS